MAPFRVAYEGMILEMSEELSKTPFHFFYVLGMSPYELWILK